MPNILSMFAKSPFEPLYEHRVLIQKCVDLVKPLFEALFNKDTEKFIKISAEIDKAESDADDIKIEIRNSLPKGVFLPVHREDLLRYLKIQDNVADCVEDITVLLHMKPLAAPDTFQVEVLKYIDSVLETCSLAERASKQLRTIVPSGFKGQEVQIILDLANQLETAEHETDKEGHDLAKCLFEHEDQMKASDLILWFRILDLIGNLADYSNKTGEWLRTMLIR